MTLDAVLEAARQLHAVHPDLNGFAPWPDDLTPSGLQPRAVPASDLVANLTLPGTQRTDALVQAVKSATHLASWKRTYTEEEVGADFRNCYGYYELFGPTGHFHSTQLRGYIGFWGEGLSYDWHSHEAEELYLNIAGEATFYADEDRVSVPAGETRAHNSWQSHAMVTHGQPILTFVLWRGAGMADLPKMDAA
ncbi:dimethylsulfonioproprionate lyase family protein [Falsiruegeria mediterranea]|uniref:Dimethlysulfonioproprionate lyase DddQ n=1 Tax=Falsiruegeria mediterranea M17 TaxID=1200281 RepID=A0A2R8C9H7_9RHOB|nr:dimethylsulfonioproprionate lyase family protein [Falsiruegeria mediterranea]SPJ29079.1 Dimethlysulfonioproprionate lyase DddQ [Falsiruegeria mediterranea M17]